MDPRGGKDLRTHLVLARNAGHLAGGILDERAELHLGRVKPQRPGANAGKHEEALDEPINLLRLALDCRRERAAQARGRPKATSARWP